MARRIMEKGRAECQELGLSKEKYEVLSTAYYLVDHLLRLRTACHVTQNLIDSGSSLSFTPAMLVLSTS